MHKRVKKAVKTCKLDLRMFSSPYGNFYPKQYNLSSYNGKGLYRDETGLIFSFPVLQNSATEEQTVPCPFSWTARASAPPAQRASAV